MAHLLITGGAGFIGSHTCLELLQADHSLVVIDNFSNSEPEALRRVCELAGLEGWRQQSLRWWSTTGDHPCRMRVFRGDVRSRADLSLVFDLAEPIDAVLHFAGLKSVTESVAEPLKYWDVNVCGSLQLLAAMQLTDCRTIIFSSSATIYGDAQDLPIPETTPVQPLNPYGHSKASVEQLLADLSASAPGWRIACLRYFNPVGAHPSGCIGEDPHGIPTNLIPVIQRVAMGKESRLKVFGCDWPTRDGTGVRDYIHVLDLAEGHNAALNLLRSEEPQLLTMNLGTGSGHTVLEVARAFAQAADKEIPIELIDRRKGDSAMSVADPSRAARRMGWQARRSLIDMCRDAWRWQQHNPEGYLSEKGQAVVTS